VDCAIGMRCKAIMQNIQLVSFQQEAILKERRVEGLNTLFGLTVMDHQGNVHLCKDGVTVYQIRVSEQLWCPRQTSGGKMSTLDAPCDIIWTLTPFLRRTLKACHATVDINCKHSIA